MKTHLSVFALSAILVVSIGMAPAFGQIQNSIVVTTDKTAYAAGDTIVVTGEVRDIYSGTPVALIVKSPDGQSVVHIAQITVGADRKFSTEITAGGVMKAEGEYTITVQYGNPNRSATTSFEFGGSTTTIVEEPDNNVDSGVTETTVSVEGSDDLIGYEITGGKLLSIVPEVDAKSLIITIEATEDGTLTLTIPRTVFDSVDEDGNDKEIFVLVDSEEVSEYDEVTTPTDRTITIGFPAGAEQIEIIGTFVVPEFGTIAVMVLAVAIISLIAISARSRLGIMPRY